MQKRPDSEKKIAGEKTKKTMATLAAGLSLLATSLLGGCSPTEAKNYNPVPAAPGAAPIAPSTAEKSTSEVNPNSEEQLSSDELEQATQDAIDAIGRRVSRIIEDKGVGTKTAVNDGLVGISSIRGTKDQSDRMTGASIFFGNEGKRLAEGSNGPTVTVYLYDFEPSDNELRAIVMMFGIKNPKVFDNEGGVPSFDGLRRLHGTSGEIQIESVSHEFGMLWYDEHGQRAGFIPKYKDTIKIEVDNKGEISGSGYDENKLPIAYDPATARAKLKEAIGQLNS